MKESGLTALSMVKAPISSPMATSFRDPTDKVSLKGLVNINGRTAAFISANSKMDSNTAKESGESVSMRKTATCMKETTRTIRKMEWVSSPGRAVTSIKGVTRMTKDTAMEKCTGKTDPVTKVNGRRESSMVLEGCNSQMVE